MQLHFCASPYSDFKITCPTLTPNKLGASNGIEQFNIHILKSECSPLQKCLKRLEFTSQDRAELKTGCPMIECSFDHVTYCFSKLPRYLVDSSYRGSRP
jgi:hypothetical protein